MSDDRLFVGDKLKGGDKNLGHNHCMIINSNGQKRKKTMAG